MNQVEQSVTEYVDEVWEDVVADIEQLVSYPSVAVAAGAVQDHIRIFGI